MTVCVAVVVKDRREQMRRCLDALESQSLTPEQLVVIDNCSTDGTLEMLRQRGIDVRVSTGPLGAARQAALDACTEDLLAFTDSDCVPHPTWLASLVASASDAEVVQGRTIAALQSAVGGQPPSEIDRFTGLYECCNLLYRADALRKAGGFDASTGFFGEDTAAGWRLRLQGGRGVFATDAVVEHDVTHPGAGWHLRRGLQYAAWPRLVREFPTMRTELLHRRVFLNPSQVPVFAAFCGIAATALTRRSAPLLAVLPWLATRRPRRRGRDGIADSAAGLAFDTAVLAGLLRGSVKERRVVL